MSINAYHRIRRKTGNVLCHVFLAVLSIIWLLPIAWLVMHSFREESGAFVSYVIPRGFTLQNYINLFTNTSTFNFPLWFWNTLRVAIASCLLSTSSILMVSYVFSRLRFPARRGLMNILMILGLFPGVMAMVAVFHVLNLIGLTQSLTGLTIVYASGAAMGYFIAKGFFDTIPRSIDEAAIVDGASKNTIFWKITLPMSRPIITYTMIITFLAPWADFMLASILMRGMQERFTVAVGLRQMIERETVSAYFTQFCAGAVIVSIPLMILFLYTQKFYVEGITGGANKG
ncbi:MAG: sugar ABC transporter permease [Defluviitaleaceae bacterium]|nr:sugar ABC transporter permease [Defluviitaleaceae bacterium]